MEWTTAIALDPTQPVPYFALARQYEMAGDFATAIKTLDGLKRANPAEKHVACRQSELHLEAGRWYRALRATQEALAVTPDCPLAHAVLATLYAMAGDNESALRQMEDAHKAAPQHERVTRSYVEALARAGRVAEAFAVAGPLAQKAEDPVRAAYLLGWLYSEYGANGKPDYRQAEVWLRKALAAEPAHPASHVELGMVLARQGRYAEALRSLDRGLRAGGGSAEAFEALASAQARLKRPEAAETKRYAAARRAADSALQTARRAYLARPDDSTVSLRLAELEARSGNTTDALTIVEEVLKKDTENTRALDLFHRIMSARKPARARDSSFQTGGR